MEGRLHSRRWRSIAVDFPWDASACMGTGAYSETMVRALAKAAPGAQITLIVSPRAPENVVLPNVRYRTLPEANVLREGGRQVALPSLLHSIKADCLFAPATLLPLASPCPRVTTVHDLSFLRKPEFYGPGLLEYLLRWFDPSLTVAERIVAVSDETRDELRDFRNIPPVEVDVVRQPVRETFLRPLTSGDVATHLNSMGVRPPFYFHVSNLSLHKNLIFAIHAFARFLGSHPDSQATLVIAGGGYAPNQPPDFMRAARDLGIGERIQYVGKVSDERLKALYQGCEAFLFPSLAEGWGLPVAEAAALGTRVIASPHVPSARRGQHIPLEESSWARAMADASVGRPGGRPVSMEEAGRRLFRIISEAVHGKIRSSKGQGAARILVTETSVATPTRLPGISGCTILRNGVKLRYPFMESVASYAQLCEEVVLLWDPTSEDETRSLVRDVAARFPNVRLIENIWDMRNRVEGTELARQTQIAFGHCRSAWTLYIQADEALHERYHDALKVWASDPRVAAVAFQRLSFKGSLDREITEHRTRGMIRMFRSGYGRSLGDAMHVGVSGYPGHVLDSEATVFNYSRLGSDEDIVTRCTNLHRFYHNDAWLAARDRTAELEIKTVPFNETHPAPIEASFRRRSTPSASMFVPRVSAHVIAQERDPFGADLLSSCLDSLEGYADQIVVVDNGLGPEALEAVLDRRRSMPITLIDAREVSSDFAELRNRALAATSPGITHIHKIDSDEVYLPGSLQELKDLLRDPAIGQVNAKLLHFMIEPTLLESIQSKEVVFRRDDRLLWEGVVHERVARSGGTQSIDGPGCFLHFGYCRPQWQTLLKWLRYAVLQGSDLSHYKYEFIDGVRRPWFRDGRTPDTILEPRRARLKSYGDSYPQSVRPWLEHSAQSGKPWREWVNRRVGTWFWDEWRALERIKGSWEGTLEEILDRWTRFCQRPKESSGRVDSPVAGRVSQVLRSRGPSGGRSRKEEFRRGFSIIIPTWNNLAYLKKAIESIRAYSDFDHEIVIHINDGSDGTRDWVTSSRLKHTYTHENVGICTAINRMTDLCSRDLVMYWNDDMVALPEWDRWIVEYAESHDLDQLVWLTSTLIEPTGDNPSFIAPADYGTDVEQFDQERLLADLPSLRHRKADQMGTSWAPNLLYRETFDRVGRMSEEFSPGFGSDPDLAKKLWDLGMRHFVGVGSSLVYHFQCKGTSKIPKHLHNDAQGTFFRKHGMTIHDFIFGVLRKDARTPDALAQPIDPADLVRAAEVSP